jgi:hypothetical protein
MTTIKQIIWQFLDHAFLETQPSKVFQILSLDEIFTTYHIQQITNNGQHQ